MGGTFGKVSTAVAMKDLIKRLADERIEALRPRDSYGTVVEATQLLGETSMAVVTLEDGSEVRLPCPGVSPLPGERVRISGPTGDRYISEQVTGYPLKVPGQGFTWNGRDFLATEWNANWGIWDYTFAGWEWQTDGATDPTLGNGVNRSTYQFRGNYVKLHLDIEWGSTTTRGGNGTWRWTLPIGYPAKPGSLWSGTAHFLQSGVQWHGGLTSTIDNRTGNPGADTLVIQSGQNFVGANYPVPFATSMPAGSRIVADIDYEPDLSVIYLD